MQWLKRDSGTPYNSLYEEALSKGGGGGTFFRLKVYERVAKSVILVWKA